MRSEFLGLMRSTSPGPSLRWDPFGLHQSQNSSGNWNQNTLVLVEIRTPWNTLRSELLGLLRSELLGPLRSDLLVYPDQNTLVSLRSKLPKVRSFWSSLRSELLGLLRADLLGLLRSELLGLLEIRTPFSSLRSLPWSPWDQISLVLVEIRTPWKRWDQNTLVYRDLLHGLSRSELLGILRSPPWSPWDQISLFLVKIRTQLTTCHSGWRGLPNHRLQDWNAGHPDKQLARNHLHWGIFTRTWTRINRIIQQF